MIFFLLVQNCNWTSVLLLCCFCAASVLLLCCFFWAVLLLFWLCWFAGPGAAVLGLCWGCDGARSPFLAVSAVHQFCTARFSHFFFTPYNFLPKATPWTARPSMRAGKKYDLTFMHSTARSFWGKATPDCSFSHQSITKIFDPTVIPNERARFFGIRARPRDPTQSVSSMRPLSPHSMMKKKSFGNGK